MAIATSTFLPWLRRGIANRIQSAAGAGASRAQLNVALTVGSDQTSTDLPPVAVGLVGPGDITGFQKEQIIRTEPRTDVTDFEWNYLTAVDFYDEDFPWRYTPLAVEGGTHRLTPWITLVVLKDEEFTRNTSPAQPLPSFLLTSTGKRPNLFPVLGQEWAWAHVHLNASLGGTANTPDLGQLNAQLATNPDSGYSRLLCPRRLDPGTRYTAVLTATFEVGRKAGLGEVVSADEDGSVRAWAGSAVEFPIYYEWSFRTGVEGDFESLVRALVPRDLDPRVGIRDLEIAHPGFGVDDVTNPPANLVGLEGALLAPTAVRAGLDPSNDYVAQVLKVLNAPAELQASGSTDPLVAPPIYGCWPAQTNRVSSSPNDVGWVNSLNLDPRYRAAAGLGARVIRANQEEYLRTAWEQIGDVLTVNHKIRRAQLATKAAFFAYAKSAVTLPKEQLVALASPVFSKVLGSPKTLHAIVKASRVPRAALSVALRKQLRPRGRLAKGLLLPDHRASGIAHVISGISGGTLTAAPARPATGGPTLETVNAAMAASSSTGSPRRISWQLWLLLAVIVIPIMLLDLWVGLAALALGAAAVFVVSRDAGYAPRPAATSPLVLLSASELSAASIVNTAAQPAFAFYGAGTEGTLPASMAPAPTPPVVAGDNPAAAEMRQALQDFQSALAHRVVARPERPALDLDQIGKKTLAALEPHGAFARRFAARFQVNGLDVLTYAQEHYVNGAPDAGGNQGALREVMNYPDIKTPMSVPLSDLSSEYLVPNLQFVPNNTIGLLQTNEPFIESYLVGLNHEFARELLWREYPTDQQGSYFRQFWDVSHYVDRQGRDPQTLAEALKDIGPIHQWPVKTALGSHNHRATQGEQAQVVLAIRGDLLKRYPHTFVYAQKATWGAGARANRLILSDETGELFATAPQDPRLRFPLYQASVDPDITFIGFDLTLEEARGDPRLDETAAARAEVGDNLGWFFVLQEAVGEPRFGLDVNSPLAPDPLKWHNLAWTDLDLSGGQAIDVAKAFITAPAGSDNGVTWGSNAADLAFILYQEPSLVGIHGRTMLKNLQTPTPNS